MGRPQTGPGSIARFGRRLGALFIDWMFATLIVNVVTGSWSSAQNAQPLHQLAIYGVWLTLMIISVPIAGGTLGHRLCRLAVTPMRGGWPGLWRPAVRAILLALLIPALVWDSDSRGFHDKIAGTVLVRT